MDENESNAAVFHDVAIGILVSEDLPSETARAVSTYVRFHDDVLTLKHYEDHGHHFEEWRAVYTPR